MKYHPSPIRAGLLLAALWSTHAMAAEPSAAHASAHANAELASLKLEQDPYAKVYIVSSQATYQGAKGLMGVTSLRSDSVGTQLVVSEIRAHQLSVLSEHVHRTEKRCGGYFAFATRAEAEAFVRNDRSAQALARSLAVNYTIDNGATVTPWLSQVNEQKIYDTINHLQSYTNRYYSSPTGKSSAEWIRNTWQGLGGGRSDVSTELFSCAQCSTQPSVILTVQGSELPGEVVVLGAHLDSINVQGGGSSTQVAPGADDDASGIATLTEVMRVALANGWKPKRTVKFMGYAAEEVGLRGSNAIAQSFRSAGTNVVGVLQVDMTNYKSGSVEDMQLVTDYSNADLKTFFTQLFDTYLAPTGLTRGTYTCGYGCSDHASWTSAGFPAAMMFEAGGPSGYNPNIHTTQDTLASMGETAEHSVKFAKFGLAFLGELAKTGTGGGGGEPPTPTPGVQTYTNGTDVAIRDFATVESAISVSGRTGNAPSSSTVAVNIVHTYIGDLKVDLVAPDGSVYVLHNRTGSSTDNINKTYTVNLSGEALNGSWKLRVNDGAGGDIGRIDTWSVTF